jgi:hypothetical protein
MEGDSEILIITTFSFVSGLLVSLIGWWGQHRELARRNLNQLATIQVLTLDLEGVRLEMKLLKECRFHGGTPPPKPKPPSMFGTMIYSPQQNTVFTADQVRGMMGRIL